MIKLTPRLQAAASLVRSGAAAADIGTDHAYLPAYLCQTGKIPRAIATDVRKGPLENAAKTLEEHGLSDRVSLRLSDGLESFGPDEVNEILICGMGGILIADILSRAAWLCEKDVHLVLQPMSHPQFVRAFLCEKGFYIDRELYVREGRRVYLCLSAVYTGVNTAPPEGYYYFGSLDDASPDAAAYAKKIYAHAKKRFSSLSASGAGGSEEAQLLKKVCAYYEERRGHDEGV